MTNTEIENELLEMGFDVIKSEKGTVAFWHNGNVITYYVKKQWASGKGIIYGRGWNNLLKQIKPVKRLIFGLSKNDIINAVKEALCESEMQDNTNYNDISEAVYYKLNPLDFNKP